MMPDLIDSGYLYIAQPPLFRVGKGKAAVYIKDEGGLDEFLMKRVCQNTKVMGHEGQIAFEKEGLYTFLGKLIDYGRVLGRLKRRGLEREMIEFLMKNNVTTREPLQDKAALDMLVQKLLSKGHQVGELVRDEEHNTYELVVSGSGNGASQVRVGWGLISSADFQSAVVLWKDISSQDSPPFTVYHDGREAVSIDDRNGLVSYLLEEAKKGLSIQRYKGLGEMNPDQLWETTMDPEKRTLLKVKIEDMFEAHDIFTVLMGGEVDLRRQFIESNALEVRTLDI
jgi:DNA gyrase subunit B